MAKIPCHTHTYRADGAAAIRALLKTCWAQRSALAAALTTTLAGSSGLYTGTATLNVCITLAGGFFGQAPEDEWLTPDER